MYEVCLGNYNEVAEVAWRALHSLEDGLTARFGTAYGKWVYEI